MKPDWIDNIVSHTHDEPDHDDDLSTATGIINSVWLVAAIVGGIYAAALFIAYAVAGILA
jgi:hypothetical protein